MMCKSAGYTILEVLVAVIILALVLPGLAGMVIVSRKTQVTSVRFENAASFGQSTMDALLMMPSERVVDGSKTASIDGQVYTAKWTMTPDPKGGRNVLIEVDWIVGGKAHSSTLRGVMP